ncbi:hypothetical protein QYF61_008004 [Mycteria americana]|uniref:Orn/DAP/Arg decarboxylase 2 N-terminal domain-containing protein n=1 Tax=Mycteria americana TaxID=33587 RepID=A0AAN7MMA2_MYCAM|nr:hypothetical protein QYF61_008004 [Mycteria americana]
MTMNGYLNESNFMMVEEGFTTRDLLENFLMELCQESDQQAFFVADLGDIVKKHLHFLKALPRVKPYFPVKCNGTEGVIRLLAELGAGFACTNKAEIARVQSIGVPADKIFYSSPCKQVAHIKYAANHGVQLMTFDNEVELSKVAGSHPRARMLLGIAADSSPSAHPSMMFGATLKSCRHLLEAAKEQAVEVVGIRYSTWSFFHRGAQPVTEGTVGSSALPEQRRGPRSHRLLWLGTRWRLGPGEVDPCWDQFGAGLALREGLGGSVGPARQSRLGWRVGSTELPPAFAQSVAAAQLAFEMGTELGYQMHLLDIGGGFPGTEDTRARFEEIAAVINSTLDLYFPDGCGVEIVARPGRYYVTSAFTFAASITATEEVPAEQPGSDGSWDEEESGGKKSLVYHLSDGIYGTFSCLLFDSPCPRPQPHKVRGLARFEESPAGPLRRVPSPQPTLLSLASWLAPASKPEESRGRGEEAMVVYQEGCNQSP